jgi:hypothetical protein
MLTCQYDPRKQRPSLRRLQPAGLLLDGEVFVFSQVTPGWRGVFSPCRAGHLLVTEVQDFF